MAEKAVAGGAVLSMGFGARPGEQRILARAIRLAGADAAGDDGWMGR